MTLKDCTKQELLHIIDRFKDYAFDNGDYYLKRCLHEVEREREIARLNEADKWAQIAHHKRLAYCELMKKWQDTPLTQIPKTDLKKAETLLEEARQADKKYMALIK